MFKWSMKTNYTGMFLLTLKMRPTVITSTNYD